jgi:hypothetical protein
MEGGITKIEQDRCMYIRYILAAGFAKSSLPEKERLVFQMIL